MADLKISQLTGSTTPLAGTEALPVVQGGVTKQVSVANLTAGRDVATAALTSTKTSAGAVVDVATIQNANSTAGTEAALFFAPTAAAGNIRGARISAVNDGNNVISIKVYTGTGAAITAKYEFTDDGNLKQLVANKGVNFTANTPAAGMTSQLLNWYEEGKYDIAITCGTSGTVTLEPTQNAAFYTRIGRSVNVQASVRVASVSSPVGYFTITLPYAIAVAEATTVSFSAAVGVAYSVSSTVGSFIAVGVAGESQLRVYLDTGNQLTATAADQLRAASDIWFSLSYVAA